MGGVEHTGYSLPIILPNDFSFSRHHPLHHLSVIKMMLVLRADEIDFTPLQNYIDSIKRFKLVDVRISGLETWFKAFVNEYEVKLRITKDKDGDIISASCSCPDFVYRRMKSRAFCKHVLYTLDFISRENSSSSNQ